MNVLVSNSSHHYRHNNYKVKFYVAEIEAPKSLIQNGTLDLEIEDDICLNNSLVTEVKITSNSPLLKLVFLRGTPKHLSNPMSLRINKQIMGPFFSSVSLSHLLARSLLIIVVEMRFNFCLWDPCLNKGKCILNFDIGVFPCTCECPEGFLTLFY